MNAANTLDYTRYCYGCMNERHVSKFSEGKKVCKFCQENAKNKTFLIDQEKELKARKANNERGDTAKLTITAQSKKRKAAMDAIERMKEDRALDKEFE